MERIMTKISLAVVSAALAIGMAVPVSAATTDPEILIYRFPGVLDDGSAANVGIATVFHCTNFSGATETLRLVTRSADGTLKSNVPLTINHLQTLAPATHIPFSYIVINMTTNFIAQGTTAIAATSINIICTAMTIDAANAKP